ncbi:potassium channel protein [bacterium]|nr:potassium channel protein [bacterium]
MQSPLTHMLRGGIFFGLTTIMAIAGYMWAGWDLLDAVYMTVITIFGVGFGEVRPLTEPWLRVFTMFVIMAGCSSAVYVIGGFVQMVAEGEIYRVLGARRMTRGIELLQNHVILCGYGRVGQHLARELQAAHQQFVIVDTVMEQLRDAEAAGLLVLVGDATEEAVLKTAGIDRARVLASVLSSDAANVFITLTARELNPKIEIIARAESNSTEKKLLRSGANRVVLPTMIGATKIANLISRPSAESLLIDAEGKQHLNDELDHIGLKLQEFELTEGSPLVGQQIREIEVSGASGFVVVAVRRADGVVVQQPVSTFMLNLGDTIILLGHRDHLASIARKTIAKREIRYRGSTT